MQKSIPVKRSAVEARGTIWKKLGWFAGIWIGSILILAAVAYFIKLILK
jgi:K+-transporting ATPase A subunit